MNYFILIYIIMLLFCSVRSDSESCDFKITNINYKKIDVDSYCSSEKPCIIKCCGENEVIHVHGGIKECKNIQVLKKELSNHTFPDKLFDYSQLIEIYQNDIYKSVQLSSKKFKEFQLLHSRSYVGRGCASALAGDKKLLEKGTLTLYQPNHYNYWNPGETLQFCVDIMVGISAKSGKPLSFYQFLHKHPDNADLDSKNFYTAFAMMISAFFLALVLAVYVILPQLRNIQGMLLMAYVATLMCMYVLKASYIFYGEAEKRQHRIPDCTLITKIIYYFIFASFFWLKLMSFDIWWTFRGTRKLREIHRRGINVKFMIYASYAYGVPAAIVIFYSIMDTRDLPVHVMKPFFNQCFIVDTTFFYLYVPLIILTGCNCLLFVMTLYNIWLIKRNMATFDKTTVNKNKKNQNTFMLYIKLCSIMGVSWILELIQLKMKDDDVPVWLYVLMNAYNVFIGVIIFFMFVFKRSIFLMLCKRCNIENRWTRQQYKVNSTRSELSKSSKNYSRTRSTTDSEVEEGTAIKMNEGGKRNSRLYPEFTTAVSE